MPAGPGRLAAAAVVAAAGLTLAAGPTAAHPSGEPQSVQVAADGTVVTLTWSAAPDDLLVLGGAVGALPDRRTVEFHVSPDGDHEPVGTTDAERLTGSSAVADYLAEHLAVRQDGRSCPAEVSLAGLVEAGATATFTCPRPVTDVEIEVTTLTDLDEAYETVAVGAATRPDRALYTRYATTHSWSFDQATSGGTGWAVVWPAGAAVAAALAGLAGGWALRRRARTR